MALSFKQLLFTTQHHRHLAIVGLAQAGGTVRQIAQHTGLGRTTVYRVLKSVHRAPGCGYGMRQFFIENIEWASDGRVLKRLPSSGTVFIEQRGMTDWEQEDVEDRALNAFSDCHGYCIEACQIEEVLRG
ncbi:helix-turn-helix domain-containing protein [Stenotrophomonas maltophilia]|uniref:helix-turn-helix domain-containing protein n=1 Tax=Stenotrophomonas maltophilia TaxID=40324 RepID=UPI00209B39BA|nr:helix-turn-helix domain-containing protein [Stenotrophomonas maltophilia]MCO7473032.1 helix-turn-helix domain-containing protein [Stenotrophomonas maltophilia]